MDYLIRYTQPNTNEVKYFEYDSIEEFAEKEMGFHIDQRNDGGWEVWLVGDNVAHYTNEWTYDEVKRNYFRDFTIKNNWKNIEYFKKI